MGIAERKLEEKQEMHKRILNGARKVFLEKGYEQASMRSIANEINYSPGSIYFYFKDKSEIFQELHKEGFGLLLNQFKVLDKVGDPFERLKAMGRIFIQFAQENKDYYNLMFLVEEPAKMSENDGGFKIAQEAIDRLASVIKDCQKKGRFKDLDTEDLTFMILSAMHGICALFCKDRTTSFIGRTNEELMQSGYECFVALLEKS
ncbi:MULTISPECIES: TetR/AcrR family transcriptional regulator [Mucilaginibacter]|jgi:AcrR family transcriptional regulator|uniref:TetR/AcrR family transcriptional regulator n=1 Tax=Mucilaginibacter rubeus TaxID=2027860 RepID=A0AAE6JFC2_9SPHI|nr:MULTISPECIES: TetR/AcrR family transcriptional regulator [Mucilaginibacter]QEM03767.1 TetR/AcrR family transcriptional regulator [Mucilaginibacter rubeus]QEM16379.1 TetR/AcrR family transcriptional regulator [Mucilaginibacter gossypii]QTE38570.1 TetR/AcrR family transcriptional regulator [Mucilaginibacter gossypii]QTE40854.1 TetR/AcrR family transcriptional regulator [Mucilaginibacter rubeus]QTE47457.1 TetR/AcrR family transcriptional regulator [Mucilaginibacter rubeus]